MAAFTGSAAARPPWAATRRPRRVLPVGHRRRPRVVGEAGDRRAVARDGHDPLDDADGHPVAVQGAALLDVQLEVGAEPAVAPRLRDVVGVAADAAEAVRLPEPAPPPFEELAGHGARSVQAVGKRAALLVRPDDDLERVARDDAGGIERADGL